MSAYSIWDHVLGCIEAKVGRHSFHTWFKPTSLLADQGAQVSVRVPNPLFTEWLPRHYSVVLAEALKDVGRPNTELIFVPEAKTSRETQPIPAPPPPADAEAALAPASSVGLNPRYTFRSEERRGGE